MSPKFLQMVVEHDEVGLEQAFSENECEHFFRVDWGEDDADIVSYCAKCLNLPSLTSEWRDEGLYIAFDGRETQVPLQMDVADRHITICTLNNVLNPGFEVRFLVFTHGSDTLGFAALGAADWQELERANPGVVAENFIDPRQLPNLMTELIDDNLPAAAKARFERMIARRSWQ